MFYLRDIIFFFIFIIIIILLNIIKIITNNIILIFSIDTWLKNIDKKLKFVCCTHNYFFRFYLNYYYSTRIIMILTLNELWLLIRLRLLIVY